MRGVAPDYSVEVRSRNFSNRRIGSLDWRAQWPLGHGIVATYPWIAAQVKSELALARPLEQGAFGWSTDRSLRVRQQE